VLCQILCKIERRRPACVFGEIVRKFLLEIRVILVFFIGRLKLFNGRSERLGYVLAAILAELAAYRVAS
jgi:hypothetical protein